MPKRVARVRFLGEVPPRAFAIDWWETTAWTIPERVKPRMSGQRISHNILKDVNRACPMLLSTCMVCLSLLHSFAYIPILIFGNPHPPGMGICILYAIVSRTKGNTFLDGQ